MICSFEFDYFAFNNGSKISMNYCSLDAADVLNITQLVEFHKRLGVLIAKWISNEPNKGIGIYFLSVFLICWLSAKVSAKGRWKPEKVMKGEACVSCKTRYFLARSRGLFADSDPRLHFNLSLQQNLTFHGGKFENSISV